MSHKYIPIHEEDEIEIRVKKDDFTEEVDGDDNPGNGNDMPDAIQDTALNAANQVVLPEHQEKNDPHRGRKFSWMGYCKRVPTKELRRR